MSHGTKPIVCGQVVTEAVLSSHLWVNTRTDNVDSGGLYQFNQQQYAAIDDVEKRRGVSAEECLWIMSLCAATSHGLPHCPVSEVLSPCVCARVRA